MACNCNVCWAWQPCQWSGWQWIDTEAPCSITEQVTASNSTCSNGSIIKPKDFVKRVDRYNEALSSGITGQPSSVTDQMEQWYHDNKTQFVMVQDGTKIREDTGYQGDIEYIPKDEEDARILRICLQPNVYGDKLFKHQQEDFLRYKDESEDGIFLEQGCGKSAIVLRIASYLFLHKKIDSLLVVAPNDVHKQWAVEQIPIWLPSEVSRELQCFGGRGGIKECNPFYQKDYLHIVCVNIDTFSTPKKWQDIALWVKSTKCMVILDEATCIKNISTKRTQRMLYEFNDVTRRRTKILTSKVNTVARAILTGTPATNGVTDLWCLMEFLRPNYFGRNWYSFRQRYAMLATITTAYGSTQIMLTPELWQGIKNMSTYNEAYAVFGCSADTYDTIQMQEHYQGAYKHEEELKELIKPVSVFRTLKDCIDMPTQIYNKKTISMSSEQINTYHDMEKELLAVYGGATTTAANKLSALIRLQQISSGFIVQGQFDYDPEEFQLRGDDAYDLEPGQVIWLGTSIPKLEQLYRDIEESSMPSIIITRFSAEASRIYDDLSKQHRCLLYTGWKKTGTIEEFKDGKYDFLVANIRVISRGFNLQNSCQMFFYSNTFSLEDRLQTEGRIFRIGQRSPCCYTDYINKDTIDLKVVGALRQKRALLDYIRGTSITSFIEDEDEITQMEKAI